MRWMMLILSLSSVPSSDVSDAIVRVGNASGVCVDSCGLVMTAKHLSLPDVVVVRFGNRSATARRVYQCPEPDGPDVFDCAGDGYPHVSIAPIVPPRGSLVSSAGFPMLSSEVRWASGRMLWESRYSYDGQRLHLNPQGDVRANSVDFAITPGWSGGPLFNDRGEFSGLCLASNRLGSLFATHASIRAAYDAAKSVMDNAAGKSLPLLQVRCREQCPPCKRFKDDWAADAAFRKALSGRYRVEITTVAVDDPSVLTDSFPTFRAADRKEVVGYRGPEKLLKDLGIAFATVPPPPDDLPEPTEQPAIVQVDRPQFVPPAVASLPLPPPPAVAVADPVIPPTIARQTPEVVAQPQPSGVGSTIGKVADVAATAWTIAQWGGLIGATGGIGGLVMGGIALARTIRRVLPQSRSPPADAAGPVCPPLTPPQPAVTPPTITVETAPPPQAIITETRFAPYERDTFNEAYSYAIKEYTRTYPGSVATIEAVNALMDQYLTSKGIKPQKR